MPVEHQHSESGSDSLPFEGLQLAPNQEPCRIGTTYTHGTVTVAEDSSIGCGGKSWEAAPCLIEYLQYMIDCNSFPFRSVLELGAGTGIVSLSLAASLPQSLLKEMKIVITDLPQYLELISANLEANAAIPETVDIHVLPCEWGQTQLTKEINDLHPFDLILCSDCVYREYAFQPLIDTLKLLTDGINGCSTQIWMCSKNRRNADKKFWKMLRKSFELSQVTDAPHHAIYSTQRLSIYKVTRKTNVK